MSDKIRILEVIKSFNVENGGGGAERFAIELAKSLDPQRFDIYVCGLWDYSTQQERERIKALSDLGISVFCAAHWDERSPYGSMLAAIRGLKSTFRRHPADIVNSHSEFADVAILTLRISRCHPKLIRTMHHSLRIEWIDRPLRRFFFSFLLLPLLCDLEIGVSQTLVDQLDRRLLARILSRRARRIHNGIDISRFINSAVNASEKRISLGIPASAFVVGTIGRLVELKGYSCLLESASIVIKQNPEVVYLIIGDGDLFDELKDQAVRLGISSKVIFAGGRSDIEELLNCMDLFVSSSYWEALPTVILESMAACTPITATDIPGTRDLIQDKQNGWLFPPGDAVAMARTILTAINDPTSRRVFAERARQDVESYSINVIALEYGSVYATLAQSPY